MSGVGGIGIGGGRGTDEGAVGAFVESLVPGVSLRAGAVFSTGPVRGGEVVFVSASCWEAAVASLYG